MATFSKRGPLSISRFKGLFSVLLLISCAFNLSGQKRIPYEFKKFTVTEGLPDNTVYGSLQDSRKYLWFFTPAGASRFDGRHFENYSISDNLSDNEILGGMEDSKGRLWFRTFNGKFSYFNTQNNKIMSYKNDSLLLKAGQNTTLVAIIEKKDGHILLQSNTGISEINEHIYKTKSGVLGFKVFTDKKQRIYVCRNNAPKGIVRYNDSLTEYETIVSIDEDNYQSCIADSTFYMCLRDGIYRYTLGDKDKVLFLPATSYQHKFVTHLSVDMDKNLWIGTFDGVYRVNIHNTKDCSYVFTGAHVTSVVKDHEQNYWITTMGKGVLMLPYSFRNVKILDKTNGLTENEINTIKRNPTDGTWIFSAYPNTIYTYRNEAIVTKSVIDTADQLKINKFEIVEKDVWAITQNVTVNRFKNFITAPPKRLSVYNFFFQNNTIVDSLMTAVSVPFAYINNNIRSVKNVLYAKDKSIYLLNWHLSRFKHLDADNYYRKLIKISDFGRNYALTESNEGIIWYGGIEGIGYYNPHTDTLIKLSHLHFESTVNDIAVVAENKVLVSTSGAGVYFVKDGVIVQHWQESNGLSSDICNRLVKQNDKNYWAGTSKGVTHIEFLDAAYNTAELTLFGGKNTNPATYINDLIIHNDTLTLATNAGLYTFDVRNRTPQYSKPLLRVVSPDYYVNSDNTHYQLDYSLFGHTNRINLQFQTIAFLNGEDILYTYELFLNNTSLNKDSISLKDKFILPLTSLTTGNYKIIVTAKRTDGVESDPLELYFKVNNPLWQSGWAIFLYALMLGYGIYLFSTYLNKKRHAEHYLSIKQKEETVRLEQKAIETDKQKMMLEQASLRASIDPHFIFNCLNNMLSFVYEKDLQSLKTFLPQLARLIRNSLQLGKENFISIETEKNYLTDYLMLEKMRFENKFDYAIVIDNTVDRNRLILPPLMLQIFVENAIKHGFKNLAAADRCYIAIHFTEIEGTIRCIIADNGVGMNNQKITKRTITEDDHKSMGLDIVRKRIEILNELHRANIQLSFESSADTRGTTIILDIKHRN